MSAENRNAARRLTCERQRIFEILSCVTVRWTRTRIIGGMFRNAQTAQLMAKRRSLSRHIIQRG